MRNPKNSWNKSDSYYQLSCVDVPTNYIIGEKDMKLAQQLIKAGSEHRKFLRQIFVSVDITAPLYWYKEFDTYKVGTTANSTSTMHKITSKEITLDCFEIGDYSPSLILIDETLLEANVKLHIDFLEQLRLLFLQTKDKRYWKELIRWLPESWLQTRTITLNYENILSIIHQRKNHKLDEWSKDFINWAKSLPYAKELLFLEG
ncbi:MAG: hypothetical protein ACI4M6_05420 [Christensenellaceae bacterium]